MISMDKKYQTRGGKQVVIFSVSCRQENYSVVGEYLDETDGKWDSATWTSEGNFRKGIESNYDLIEVREPREIWVNYHFEHKCLDGKQYDSKEKADFCQLKSLGPCEAIRFIEAPVVDGGKAGA